MSAWSCRQLSARPPLRSFHLVFEPHDGRALAPIPKRSTSPRVTLAPPVVDSLKALDPNRPIREADIGGSPPQTGSPSLRSHLFRNRLALIRFVRIFLRQQQSCP